VGLGWGGGVGQTVTRTHTGCGSINGLQAQQALGIQQEPKGAEKAGKRLAGLGMGFKRLMKKGGGDAAPTPPPANHFADELAAQQQPPPPRSRCTPCAIKTSRKQDFCSSLL